MSKLVHTGLVAIALAALSGCAGGPTLGSCTGQQNGAMVCIEADTNSMEITAEQYRQQCVMRSGATYSAGGCVRSNLIGRCVTSFGNSAMTLTQTYYFYPPFTRELATDFCTRVSGSWMNP